MLSLYNVCTVSIGGREGFVGGGRGVRHGVSVVNEMAFAHNVRVICKPREMRTATYATCFGLAAVQRESSPRAGEISRQVLAKGSLSRADKAKPRGQRSGPDDLAWISFQRSHLPSRRLM